MVDFVSELKDDIITAMPDVSPDGDVVELKKESLFEDILKEAHKHINGEDRNIITLILKINTRNVIGAHPTSKNIVLGGLSGMGKDNLVDGVLRVMVAPKDQETFTNSSEKAFLYRAKDNPEWNWDGKVIKFEDIEEDTMKAQWLRTFASGKQSHQTVIDGKYEKLEIKGQPVNIITSYRASIDVEGERRWDMIMVDDSEELTEKVNEGIVKRHKSPPVKETRLVKELHKNLRRYEVVIPFLEDITKDNYPKDRHSLQRLIDLVSAHTVLYQYQREKDEKGRLIATLEDWDMGATVYKYMNKSPKLSVKEKKLVEFLENNPCSTVAECSKGTGLTRTWLYKNIDSLVERKIVIQDEMMKEAGSAVKPTTVLCAGSLASLYKPRFSCDFPTIISSKE